MDYKKVAQEIYDKVGKKENLASAAHCATRLKEPVVHHEVQRLHDAHQETAGHDGRDNGNENVPQALDGPLEDILLGGLDGSDPGRAADAECVVRPV